MERHERAGAGEHWDGERTISQACIVWLLNINTPAVRGSTEAREARPTMCCSSWAKYERGPDGGGFFFIFFFLRHEELGLQ